MILRGPTTGSYECTVGEVQRRSGIGPRKRMETAEIFADFSGFKCRGCGGSKRRMTAFCPICYRELPAALRRSLWKKFGAGFEEAYQACLSWFRLHPVLKPKPPGQQQLFR